MKTCSAGHVLFESELDSLCPQCLYDLRPNPLSAFGPFERLKQLGGGGFGRVFLARARGSDELVALKIMRDPHLDDPTALRYFRQEVEILSGLRHDGVVRILEAGEHEGTPYYTMEYMPGGTLRQRLVSYRGKPRLACELVISIAEAVDHLHRDPLSNRRPVLHRDLKPENILFDASDRPKVSDFGIAKRSSDRGFSQGSQLVGSLRYMAPEQFSEEAPLTPAVDVYALGAILYELFTNNPPPSANRAGELPTFPVGFDRRLEAVVLNALEPDPELRYRSARAFAQDLRRALSGKAPPEEHSLPLAERLTTTLRQRGVFIAAAILALSLVLVAFLTVGQERRSERLASEARARENSTLASVQAVAFTFQLREYAHRVARLAQRPEIADLLRAPSIDSQSRTLIERGQGFDSLFVMNPDGRQRARSSLKSAEYLSRSFAFRDYFQAVRELAKTECPDLSSGARPPDEHNAYVSQAHVSEGDGRFEIVVVAPVCDSRGWLGILGAGLVSNRVFGIVKLEDDTSRHITALLGPRGAERATGGHPARGGFEFIVHPALAPGEEYELLDPAPNLLRAKLGMGDGRQPFRYTAPYTSQAYRDPLSKSGQLWSVAFAPVSESGFVVAVQSLEPPARSAGSILAAHAAPLGLQFGLGVGLLLSLRAALQRKRRPHRALHPQTQG
ncbi:MAG TPA: serine/threonine protein kinase [Polyangiaceae bacterium]|nr:serine/threonine protein kinase [Polyangiaceae bacterium]